ncbi:MAG: hypothetical protein KGS47_15035 [Chloroflexi bacterium]|nr:hypothetical protein [Chloroflexota bacterium]
MTAIFAKLNLRDQTEILVLHAPASFEPALAALGATAIRRTLGEIRHVRFAVAFVTHRGDVDALAGPLASLADGDAIIWFAYPRRASQHYTGEVGRDVGWAALGDVGFEQVRQVAIDEDWSASRFRRSAFIRRRVPAAGDGAVS